MSLHPSTLFRPVLALILLRLAASCAEGIQERQPDDPMALLGAFPQGAHVAVMLGQGADEGQRRNCHETVQRLGVANDPNAPVMAVIDINQDIKVLRVISQRRGVVRQEQRPAWGVGTLCRDGLAAALRVLAEEMQGAPQQMAQPGVPPPAPAAPYQPPPPYQAPPPPATTPPIYTGPPDDPRQVLAAWAGPPAQVQVMLGARASDRQRASCAETVARYGVMPVAGAPIVAVVETQYSPVERQQNLLRVTSQRRGVVVQGFRPGWTVDDLCKDALAQALRAYVAEFGTR
jgi:hypothetical protein